MNAEHFVRRIKTVIKIIKQEKEVLTLFEVLLKLKAFAFILFLMPHSPELYVAMEPAWYYCVALEKLRGWIFF